MNPSASHPSEEMYCPGCERTFYGVEYCPNDGAKLVRLLSQPDQLIGRTFDGRYTIVEKLGEGGMGSVYRSRQHSFGREVAIKVVNPGLVTDSNIIKRFLREAKLSSRLSHPNAVAVLDFGQTDDRIFYLVMELVNGRTLHDAMAETPQFSPERVVRIGTQICDALECAHDLGIVHRDLKPSNVMLLATGRDLIKVLDFGLAKSLAADDRGTTMTGTRGGLMGTPAFVAPELALGRACDHRADLYSLGCILYLIGSGWPPFSATSGAELISKHAYEQPEPMPNAPQALVSVVMRLLAKSPQDRYSSAAEARQALEDALGAPHAMSALGPSAVGSASWRSSGQGTDDIVQLRSGLIDGPMNDAPMMLTEDVTAVSVRAESPTRIVHQRRPMRLAPVIVTFLVLAALGGGGYYWLSRHPQFAAEAQPVPSTPSVNPLPEVAEPVPAPPAAPAQVDSVVPALLPEQTSDAGVDAAAVVPAETAAPPKTARPRAERRRRRDAAGPVPADPTAATAEETVSAEEPAPDDTPSDPSLPNLGESAPAPSPSAPAVTPSQSPAAASAAKKPSSDKSGLGGATGDKPAEDPGGPSAPPASAPRLPPVSTERL